MVKSDDGNIETKLFQGFRINGDYDVELYDDAGIRIDSSAISAPGEWLASAKVKALDTNIDFPFGALTKAADLLIDALASLDPRVHITHDDLTLGDSDLHSLVWYLDYKKDFNSNNDVPVANEGNPLGRLSIGYEFDDPSY